MKIVIITGGSRGLGAQHRPRNAPSAACGVILTYNSHPEGADEVVRRHRKRRTARRSR